jgi:signal transduction histidine kinase
LEEFASIVSHDLRNPLSVADGRLELLSEECDSEQIDHIASAHDRMGTLLEDMLTLAREGRTVTEFEPVDLEETVEGCWSNVETDNATLDADIDGTVQADEGRLKQVFENLIRNAVEHGSPGGRPVPADTADDGDGTVTVRVRQLPDGFYVEDDGDGIPEADRDDVFGADYSTNDEGTGFGLRIAKQIVDAHGWDIQVTDGSDGGARFEITGVSFPE